MPSSPSPVALAGLVGAFECVAEVAAALEDDLFGVLPVLGDPDLQRAVDHWVDQAVDTTRALAAGAAEEAARLQLLAPATAAPATAATATAEVQQTSATQVERADLTW